MAWEVEYTREFAEWWDSLTAQEQAAIDSDVDLLMIYGPQLGRPTVDTLKGSRLANLKELRTDTTGKPLRSFFAFDPRRTAILLIGGDKSGDQRFYKRMIPLAEQIYADYLDELKSEGLL